MNATEYSQITLFFFLTNSLLSKQLQISLCLPFFKSQMRERAARSNKNYKGWLLSAVSGKGGKITGKKKKRKENKHHTIKHSHT